MPSLPHDGRTMPDQANTAIKFGKTTASETGDPKLKTPEKAQEHKSDRNTGGSVTGEQNGE